MSADKLVGCVKWFNTKSGFGFITMCKGELPSGDKDVFVHHTGINVSDNQFKYLVKGEYVEFSLDKGVNSKHEWHANNITGIFGGMLMCETTAASTVSKPLSHNDDDGNFVKPKSRRRNKVSQP